MNESPYKHPPLSGADLARIRYEDYEYRMNRRARYDPQLGHPAHDRSVLLRELDRVRAWMKLGGNATEAQSLAFAILDGDAAAAPPANPARPDPAAG